MSDIPLTIKVDESSRLRITLSEDQMKDLAEQVAKILKEQNND